MKINFDDIFNAKPLSEMEVQDIVIQELNKTLPSDDIEYIAYENGSCIITTKKDGLKIGGFRINLDDEDRKILGDEPKVSDILDYSYNAQKSIELKLQEENIILVNDKKIEINKFIYRPFLRAIAENGQFHMVPATFPEAFKITIYDDYRSYDFMIKRVPNKSIANMEFISEENHELGLRYIINKKEKKMTLYVSYNFKCSKSIKELIKYSTLYNSFLSGKVRIGESRLKREDCGEHNMINPGLIDYWTKIHSIEQYFNITFDPTKIEMTNDEQQTVDELFFGVVKELPIRDYNSYSSFSITFKGSEGIEKLKIGEMMYFGFTTNREFSLLGQNIKVHCSCGIYNAKVKDIVSLDNQTKVEFENIDEKRKIYIVIKYFISKDALSTYQDSLTGEDIAALRKAKSILEYLRED